MREKFADLDRSKQTLILVALIVFLCLLLLFIILIGIYALKSFLFPSESERKHPNADAIYNQLELEPLNQSDESKNEDDSILETNHFRHVQQ